MAAVAYTVSQRSPTAARGFYPCHACYHQVEVPVNDVSSTFHFALAAHSATLFGEWNDPAASAYQPTTIAFSQPWLETVSCRRVLPNVNVFQ